MEPQGSHFDLAERWYHFTTYYKFYKSRLYEWFIEGNAKTENLNDLGLSTLEKYLVIDSLWPRLTYVHNFMGWESSGPVDLQESYSGGATDVVDLPDWDYMSEAIYQYNYKLNINMFGGVMKTRARDALDAPQTIFLPFISKELSAHLRMFKNFAECHKPIYINNEFYMEG